MDTELSPVKAVTTARVVSLALMSGLCFGAAILGGCDKPQAQVDNALSYIKSIDVDGSKGGTATAPFSDEKFPAERLQQGADILVRTTQDFAVGDGGLISTHPGLKINVISAEEARRLMSEQPRPILDLRPEAAEAPAPEPIPVSKDDLGGYKPVSLDALLAEQEPPVMKPALNAPISKPMMKPALNAPRAEATVAAGGRLIQIGAFSSAEAAREAMRRLIASHPKLAALKTRMETVDTPQGKRVRLKLGPIADEAQAQALCQKLNVTDTWCVRAG